MSSERTRRGRADGRDGLAELVAGALRAEAQRRVRRAVRAQTAELPAAVATPLLWALGRGLRALVEQD